MKNQTNLESILKEFDEYYPELLTSAGEVRDNVKEFITTVYSKGKAEGREQAIRELKPSQFYRTI